MTCRRWRPRGQTIRVQSGPGWWACVRPRECIVVVPARSFGEPLPAHSQRRHHLLHGEVAS